MITECKRWLAEILKEAQVERVSLEPEDESKRTAVPFAVLIAGDESLKRAGSRVAVEDLADGTRAYRKRLWRRTLPLQLRLTHRTEDDADRVLDEVLAQVFRGLDDAGGNHITVKAGALAWGEEKSVQAQRCKVVLPLTFEGGVYRDLRVSLLTDVAPEPEGAE